MWPSDGEIVQEEDILLSTLLAHGLPAAVHFVPGLSSTAVPKLKERVRKNATKLIRNRSFEVDKLLQCGSDSDGQLALLAISTMKKKHSFLQRTRPHLIAESAEKIETEGDVCTLKVSGYLRGPPLNVNSLVHVPWWGDFQMQQIIIEKDPHAIDVKKVLFFLSFFRRYSNPAYLCEIQKKHGNNLQDKLK
ncbi:unnamed protein product [Gongylonema pulchrum]|uniref:AARP2CN domain-containing protein n=1 Tax=Gongylonema pulchrum TaxID=637853 RepID=A0A3P6RN61_9BILA|nr:unnamed protein product [Gongylonema pulchrum]